MLLLLTAVSLLILLDPCTAFVPSHSITAKRRTIQLSLYDDDDDEPPVPRFVANDKNSKKENKSQNDHLSSTPRMFEFNKDGTEVRGLLPRLSRTLDSGVDCYFEQTDRKVVNLSQKTACHPMDAAWALEVFRGDTTEAWLAISTARKMLLNQQDMDEEEEEDFDAELFEMLSANKEMIEEDEEEDYEERKERLKKEKRLQDIKQATKDAFLGGEVDGKWLPRDNPKPVDDEPWFTG